jgi:hypothetical protein
MQAPESLWFLCSVYFSTNFYDINRLKEKFQKKNPNIC